jgi:tetratricopeptide (TPR) repeat protein
MKKVFMMAIALMASSMTFAGDSDALKAIMKSKDYAEAANLLKQNLGQLADNAEKAAAYNHLFELAMNKVSNETGTITENQMALQMGTGKTKPYDTLGLADGICNAIEAAIECDKYDKLPNAKGKVKPKFDKNVARVWAVRSHLVNIGQEEARKGNNAAVLKYWGMFTDSAADPYFAAMDKTPEKDYAGQVAFFAGRYAYDAKDMPRANKYFEIAKQDPTQKADAQNFQLYAMRSSLKNHADSLAFVDQLKKMYEAEPENEVIVDAINGMYEGLDKTAQKDFLNQHLQKFPNSFTALANMGLMAVNANNAEEGAMWLRKAAAVKPDNAVVYTYLGACLSVQAANSEDAAKSKDLYKQAIEAFDKAKELDPDKQMANWGYNRYQAYYGLYGADDPKTKAAEADSKR